MSDVNPKYFSAKAANYQRDLEMQAFYHNTLLEPVLEALTSISESIAELRECLNRIADAAQKLVAQRDDAWLPPRPSTPPVEESPDPTYTDDEMNFVREEAEKLGPMPPHMQRLFGEEEESAE